MGCLSSKENSHLRTSAESFVLLAGLVGSTQRADWEGGKYVVAKSHHMLLDHQVSKNKRVSKVLKISNVLSGVSPWTSSI